MKKPVLVIMAAGMGSIYGGLKQIDPVDKEGHIIMDFSIYDAVKAGFKKIERVQIVENEYYNTEQDLMALLLKVPIIDDFSEINNEKFKHITIIEKNLFDEYVRKYKTEKGILLKRRLYGIIAEK